MLNQDGFVHTVKDAAPARIYVSGPENLEIIKNAQSAKEVYDVISRDFCALLHIPSPSNPTKLLDGTRLQMVSPRAYCRTLFLGRRGVEAAPEAHDLYF